MRPHRWPNSAPVPEPRWRSAPENMALRLAAVSDSSPARWRTRWEPPVRSSAFDFVVAVQVYLYVTEIELALAEAVRVLKPGGRLAVVDTDWDSCVWLTEDRARHRRVLEARLRELGQPHLAPMLPALLRRAGVSLISVEVHPILNLRYESESLSAGLIESTPGIVTKYGIDSAEAEAWADDLKSRTSEGEYFFSFNRYLFLARRNDS